MPLVQTLTELRSRGDLPGSLATVSRWAKDSASPGLHAQTAIAGALADTCPISCGPDDTRPWLSVRRRLLNSERAIDLIRVDRTEEVLAVISRLGTGAYL